MIQTSAGQYHSLALKSDGTLIAWGYNANGWTDVPPGFSNVVAISAGSAHSMALKEDGTVVVWGSNASGLTNVPSNLGDVVSIDAGGNIVWLSEEMEPLLHGATITQCQLG